MAARRLQEEIEAAARVRSHPQLYPRPSPGVRHGLSEDGVISPRDKSSCCASPEFCSQPPMLIPGRGTSSIDTRTELKIQDAFGRMMQGRTSFIVAHRLSTIREADCILVMRSGQVVEQGRHEELLEKGGFYAKLYNSQFAKTADAALQENRSRWGQKKRLHRLRTSLCKKPSVRSYKNQLTNGANYAMIKTVINTGVVSEWFKELVLKTSDSRKSRVRIPPSPPTSIYEATSQYTLSVTMEKYSSW